MKSLIIIEHEPLTVRLKKIWNIDALRERGVHVEYWDVSELIFPSANIPEVIEEDYVRYVNNLIILQELLAKVDISRSVFVLEIFPKWENRKIIFLLKKLHCFCVRIDLYANSTLPRSFFDKLVSKVNTFSFELLLNKIRWNYVLMRQHLKIYDLTLSSSKLASPDIYINHPDYEVFYNLNSISKPVKNVSYILFIDVYFPLHPDLEKKCGIDALVKEYRTLMKRFFDFVENKFHKEIVIAAHPKAQYSGGEFGNRKIIFGETPMLVKYASMIILHGSNSISYIALANKPFAIVYTNGFKLYGITYKHILYMSKYFNKQAYNLNKCDWNHIDFSQMEDLLREKYIENFLSSSETCSKKNVDIWIDRLLQK